MLALINKLAFALVLLSVVLSVTATPILRAPSPQAAQKRAEIVEKRLSNSERIARGLPLNRPKRYFDRESCLSPFLRMLRVGINDTSFGQTTSSSFVSLLRSLMCEL